MKKSFKLAGLVMISAIVLQCKKQNETVSSTPDHTDTTSTVVDDPKQEKDSVEVPKKDTIVKVERPTVSIKSNSD